MVCIVLEENTEGLQQYSVEMTAIKITSDQKSLATDSITNIHKQQL